MATGAAMLVAGLAILVSLLGAFPSNQWWIRVWDFPRLIIFALGALALLALIALPFRGRWPIVGLLVAALGYQLWFIFPYTRFAPVEAERIALTEAERRDHCFTLLSLNVLQDNRDYGRTRRLIEETAPDMLLLMETDRTWQRELDPLLSGFGQRFDAPLPNKYGMIFATNLPVAGGRIENLAEPGTPSIHGVARTRSGRPFRFAALHPRPPHPGQDTEERDAELAIAARRIQSTGLPAVAFGDFNDVGWSRTSQLFRRLGEFVDPRIGRGFYATYPASWPAFRWPLDHLFFSEEFALSALETGEPVGSDHLPVHAEICLVPGTGEALNEAEGATAEDFGDYADIMDSYREDVIADRREGE
ncbi:endonuclease/exonuclease/phosphatase family protein [Parasphingopyxis marina]|uniref:Endonuclease/exonuclease/phosphatase family protein n=1 Tax=Parasphingopyxis marina TaxID=2761622 RepID=A0A842HYD3_9SPHN|nr:endonuclease/exonuclease/phosphatase family protein [Parasphingopyxis marina]MBC2776930.1 endonuclease/exonuclease/phosphatase family protein [Parasphingopyxis marina]